MYISINVAAAHKYPRPPTQLLPQFTRPHQHIKHTMKFTSIFVAVFALTAGVAANGETTTICHIDRYALY